MPKKNYKKRRGAKRPVYKKKSKRDMLTEPRRNLISVPRQIIPKHIDVCYKSRTGIRITGATPSSATGKLFVKMNSLYRPFASSLLSVGVDGAFVSTYSLIDAPVGYNLYAQMYRDFRVYKCSMSIMQGGVQNSGNQGLNIVICPTTGSLTYASYESAVRGMFTTEKRFNIVYRPSKITNTCSIAKVFGVTANNINNEEDFAGSSATTSDPTNLATYEIWYQTTDGAVTASASNGVIFEIELLQWARLEGPFVNGF